MALLEVLDEVKSKIKELKKKYRYRQERLQREDAVELQMTLADCRGKLEVSKLAFNRAIEEKSREIRKGEAEHVDVQLHEVLLWDAAIGYLLVRDAIFVLSTINSYESVSHAYEMLDEAMKAVSKKKKGVFPKRMAIGTTSERNVYGYITSSAALKEKELLLENIFPSLRVNGDIEGHLKAAYNNADNNPNRPDGGAAQSDYEKLLAELGKIPEQNRPQEDPNLEQNLKNLSGGTPGDD